MLVNPAKDVMSVLRVGRVMNVTSRMLSRGQGKVVEDVFIVSCARTPLGSMGGRLKVLM